MFWGAPPPLITFPPPPPPPLIDLLRAKFSSPNELECTPDGGVYVVDAGNHCVRYISPINNASGLRTISTIAGTPTVAGFGGNGGPATSALLNDPTGITIDYPRNKLYITETINLLVRVVDLVTKKIDTYAGNLDEGPAGFGVRPKDGSIASSSPCGKITGIAVRYSDGTLYLQERYFYYTRTISPTGVWGTVFGLGYRVASGDGGPAVKASSDGVWGLYLDQATGDLFTLDNNQNVLRVIRSSTGIVERVLGATPVVKPPTTESLASSPAYAANFAGPRGVAGAPAGTPNAGIIYIADWQGAMIFGLRASGTLFIAAGNGVPCAGTKALTRCGDGGPATSANVYSYSLVVVPGSGDLLLADTDSYRVRIVSQVLGTIDTYAGVGVERPAGAPYPPTDGTNAVEAWLGDSVYGVAVEPGTGRVFTCTFGGFVFAIPASGRSAGKIFTVVGTGLANQRPLLSGVQPGRRVNLTQCPWLAFFKNGTLLINDFSAQVIYAYNPGTDEAWRFAGLPWGGLPNFGAPSAFWPMIRPLSPPPGSPLNGDGSPATSATIGSPLGMVVDDNNDTFVVSSYDYNIRKIDGKTGIISTIVGAPGNPLSIGDYSSAIPLDARDAGLATPRGIAIDPYGNIFFAESASGRIREAIFSAAGTPNCPAGYTCPCGLRPQPCNNPSSFCPAGSSAAINTSSGAEAITASGVAATASSPVTYVFTGQQACGVGYFCQGGKRAACVPGTYGISTFQPSASSCIPCAAGLYLAEPGVAAVPPSPSPCLSCAPGFYAADAASPFCTACPPGTSTSHVKLVNGTEGSLELSASAALYCFPCPKNTVSGYGAAYCTPVSATVSTDTQKLLAPTFAYQRSLAFNDGNIDPNALMNLYAITAAPIVGFFGIPLMVLGFLHGVIWVLGSWIALWAPRPEPRTWHQYFRSFVPSLPTLPTFAGVKRFSGLWSSVAESHHGQGGRGPLGSPGVPLQLSCVRKLTPSMMLFSSWPSTTPAVPFFSPVCMSSAPL
jgi:hypothetical protein